MYYKLNNKLKISENEMTVLANNFVEKFRQFMFFPLILMCIVFSITIISAFNNNIFSYFIIPIFILFLVYFKFIYLKSFEHRLKTYIFKVTKNNINYYFENVLIEIPTNQIVAIEDKSFFYEGIKENGSSGWHHTFKIYISNEQNLMNTLNKKILVLCKYLKDINQFELTISDLCLSHEDHIKLLDSIKSYI